MSFYSFFFFFFNDTATTEIYTLSLHDALPISATTARHRQQPREVSFLFTVPPRVATACTFLLRRSPRPDMRRTHWTSDRKSTRLNSSHLVISYAVFCLKKKKK